MNHLFYMDVLELGERVAYALSDEWLLGVRYMLELDHCQYAMYRAGEAFCRFYPPCDHKLHPPMVSWVPWAVMVR